MQSVRLPYQNDSYGNPVHARISWVQDLPFASRPLALLYHAGGLLVGSSEIIPRAQIEYLTSHGFIVVAPNYRLCPQVTAREAVADCEQAYEWAISSLPVYLDTQHALQLDTSRIVTAGHSSGGTIAMHIGATKPHIKAVTAFYPTLYASDLSTSGHQLYTLPPFGSMPDYSPSDSDWASITPPDVQISETGLAEPGTLPPPRNRWQAHLLKTGQWLSTLCPDGQYTVLDPLLTNLHAQWPATMIVQGAADQIPGSSPNLARRAHEQMRAAGVRDTALEIVDGAPHMFDLMLSGVGENVEPHWQAVLKGLEWLRSNV